MTAKEENKENKEAEKQTKNKDAKGKGSKNAEDKEQELSEEDMELKKNLELMVERVKENDPGVQKLALISLCNEIRSTAATMTSVPKPLKFLRPHYEVLKARLEELPDGDNKALLADVVSILATTTAKAEGDREALKYRLLGTKDDIGVWGHEYLRHLAGEIADEYKARIDKDESVEQLLHLVQQIVPYHMTHNAEPEAVDLLLEVERLDLLEAQVDEKNYARTCLYLVSCCNYLPEPEDMAVLETAHKIYLKAAKYHDALIVALKTNNSELVKQTFAACTDEMEKKQLGYLLARQGVSINLEDGPCAVMDDQLRDGLREIVSNSKLSEHFLALARDLDVMEAKTPEDVYKSHLVEGRQASAQAVDSARQNLASTFVNAFVNAGFGQDKLVTVSSEGQAGSETVHWIFKNKDHGKTSATASLGMITLWDVEGGLPQIDKYLYSTDNYVVAGALLAIGIVNSCVQNENDPAFALINDYVGNADPTIRIGAILGLGLAYAGTNREEVQELLTPLICDPANSIEVAGFAALALGLVFTSTCHQDIVMAIISALSERPELELSTPFAKFMCLALGLLFLGKQDTVEATVEIAKTLNQQISRFCQITLDSLAYAGTGNVLKVQELLAVCGEHIETDEAGSWKAVHQGPAAMGIALIAMAEPLGSAMAMRALEHLLQYGEPPVRRAVPLAIAILKVSDPDLLAMDTLSRLSHDADTEVAQNAVLALGIIGAGTNNARLAGLLRNLSSYYYKEATLLFLVKAAQGLVHCGKGLMGLNPYHTDRQLLSGVALAGIMTVLYSCLDLKATIGGKHHYLLYTLCVALKPRMLLTLDDEGKMLPVPVRVGQAVDVVAQAGRPKTISGFQTHTTPVLLSVGERAELATEKYLPLSRVLEGLVILKKNPDYVETD